MKLLMYVTLASIFSGALFAGAPNVILIMADDLGYGDVSCYGSKLNRTPVLDKMASEGVKLTDYHSGSTVCTPSRMALMTGMYPPRVGWKGGVLGFKMRMSGGLSAEARTMAEVFKDAGYRTGISGKWHLGDAPERLPQGQGFEHAFYITASNNQTKKLWRNGKLIAEPFNNRRLSEEFTREAISFIERERTRVAGTAGRPNDSDPITVQARRPESYGLVDRHSVAIVPFQILFRKSISVNRKLRRPIVHLVFLRHLTTKVNVRTTIL